MPESEDDFDCGIEEESVWDRILLGETTPGDAMELREMAEENVRLRAALTEISDHLYDKQDWSRCREMAKAALEAKP
jgi:hypothetical protein